MVFWSRENSLHLDHCIAAGFQSNIPRPRNIVKSNHDDDYNDEINLSNLMYANIIVSKNVMYSQKIKPPQPVERPPIPSQPCW